MSTPADPPPTDLPEDLVRGILGRRVGEVWLRAEASSSDAGFDDVAVAAGLQPWGASWHEIDAGVARRHLQGLLHRDLAYNGELMEATTAERLARDFVDFCGGERARFATNTEGDPHGSGPGSGWDPATEATFDSGLVALGPEVSAVCWVADED